MNITDKHAGYVKKVEDLLKNKGFRVQSDLRNEKIGFKIREHTLQKVPYLLILGDREQEAETVAVRKRDGKDLGTMSLADLEALLAGEIASRGLTILED